MQTQNPFLDEFAKLTNAAMGLAQTASEEAKAAFRAQAGLPLAEAYDLAVATMVDNMLVDDAKEGIGAFLGKRMPEWK